MLSLWNKTQIFAHYAQGALAWLRHDVRYASPFHDNKKFLSAWDATRLIKDGAVVAVSGLGVHQRASILYWAVRERFETTGHPHNLTVINVGGHGGRGIAPGTLEELGRRGLCTRFITGHFETYRAMLDLAEAGECELQCVPLGVMTQLFDALARGRDSVLSPVGIGTFIDPRSGRGTPVTKGGQLVQVERGRLRYRIPKIDVALFNVPAADAKANLYAKNAATLCESYELARAAKRNGGIVIANVGLLVEPGYDRVFLPGNLVDVVIYDPDTEQTLGIPHRSPWMALTTGADGDLSEALERVRFLNDAVSTISGGLRRRSAADQALMHLATATLLSSVQRGATVAIGTGLPEELPAIAYDAGLLDRVHFVVESGVVGGLPASGMFFGAALHPTEILSSASLFRRCNRNLDATCLGVLEVDGHGDVNVSKRAHGLRDYVGPGGFMDFAAAAKRIVFVSSWMRGGDMAYEDGRIRIRKLGQPKFVDAVSEVTFNGSLALRAGKRIYYVTHVGIFELTKAGMQLIRVMPGIDIKRDILDFSRMRIVLPRSKRVPVVPVSALDGSRLTGLFARRR